MWKSGFFFVVAVLLTCWVCFLAGRAKGRETGRQEGYIEGFRAGYETPLPAVTIRDTIRIQTPAPVGAKPSRPQLVQVTDTVRITDTLWMALPTETRTYQGDDFRAVVSGWHPSLDEITVYPQTIVRQAPRKPRVGFGVTAGPAVIWTPGGFKAGAGIAGGLTIEF